MTRCSVPKPASRSGGRPRGEIAQAVLNHLSVHGPATARCLAHALQVPVGTIWYTCRRLVEASDIEVIDRRRVEGVNKQVAVYGVAARNPSQRPVDYLPAAFFARA